MARPRNAYYAVHRGHRPGVYRTWPECAAQVRNVEGARCKKFVGPGAQQLAEYFVQHGDEPDKKERNRAVREEARAHRQTSAASTAAGFFAPAEDTGYQGEINRELEPLVIFTDGSVRRDEKNGEIRAGIGVWFGPSDRRNFGEPYRLPDPTNNKCELLASIRAIECVNQMEDVPHTQELVIGSDSQYVIRAMTEWWPRWERNGFRNQKGNPVANQPLLRKLHALCSERPVSFYYTPGHVGIPGNEGADTLAATGGATQTDPGFTPDLAPS